MKVTIQNLTKRFSDMTAVNTFNAVIESGELIALLGPSGCGKSTMLNMISGILPVTEGKIFFGEEDVTDLSPEKRGIGLVFQNYALYPHMTVLENIAFPLEIKKVPKAEREAKAKEMAKLVHVDMLLNRKPGQLSGGQQQRVAIARALIKNPRILLLDEPTNSLDLEAIRWLEEFLINFDNTVIIVSHDRHFLNKVCTHIADIDYSKIKLYVGNYDFWYESSELLQRQMKESNKKKEEKIKELQSFIARFSANASKSKQATSRKKMLEKIQLDEIVPSSRKYPYIDFKIEKAAGKEILKVENLTKIVDGRKILDKVSFTILKGDKICFLAEDDMSKTMLFNILMGKEKYDKGTIEWGKTIIPGYLPQDNTEYFKEEKNIMDWIGQYYDIKDETVTRGFLGRMLFSGEDVFKKVNVLSGGEKARCMLSKIMLEQPNFLIMDEPTNHLDLESITSLNKGLCNFQGEVLFTSRDYELNSTVANRVIEIKPDGTIIDRSIPYEEYIEKK